MSDLLLVRTKEPRCRWSPWTPRPHAYRAIRLLFAGADEVRCVRVEFGDGFVSEWKRAGA